MQLLLSAGASVNARMTDGTTSLYIAAQQGFQVLLTLPLFSNCPCPSS